jgi:hypothetical protein
MPPIRRKERFNLIVFEKPNEQLQVAVFHVAGDNNSSKEAMSHGYPQT